MRQRLQQAVTVASWGDDELFRRIARKVDGELPGIEAFVVDDTGFPKKGRHSVGVARQYSGTLGRVDNCQVAVSLHLAGEAGSGCIGMRLFLPEAWTVDVGRRAAVGVPDDVVFEHKWQLALHQNRRGSALRHPQARRTCGCGLRRFDRVSPRTHRARFELRRRCAERALRVAAGRRAIPAETGCWSGSPADLLVRLGRSRAHRGTRLLHPIRAVPHGLVARWFQRNAALEVHRSSNLSCRELPSRKSEGAAGDALAIVPMAGGQTRSGEVLAL